MNRPDPAPAAAEPVAPADAAVPIHSAREMTGGGVIAYIELDGRLYTLRITKAGKLILTR